jgi:hypothetical protein
MVPPQRGRGGARRPRPLSLFRPSALEVHRRTATWFWSQEIFDFFAAHLHLITVPSMRHYLAAWELQQAGFDWKALILPRFIAGTTLKVATLKADPSFGSEEARAEAFTGAGGGCRATYFTHAAKLAPPEEVPSILLTHTRPPRERRKPRRINVLPPGPDACANGNGRTGHPRRQPESPEV